MRFEEFARQYSLVEALLESVTFVRHLRDVEFKFLVGPTALPLTLIAKDQVWFQVTRDPHLALFRHALDADDRAQEGRKTVIGVGLRPLDEFQTPQELGELASQLEHLAISTMDGEYDVVYVDLELSTGAG